MQVQCIGVVLSFRAGSALSETTSLFDQRVSVAAIWRRSAEGATQSHVLRHNICAPADRYSRAGLPNLLEEKYATYLVKLGLVFEQ